MEMYFFNPKEWDRLYLNGCRHYDIDMHPLEERKHVFIGWTFIFQFFFYTVFVNSKSLIAIGKNFGTVVFLSSRTCATPGLWIIETWTDVLLALNRCVEITSPRLADKLFRGKRTWLWFIPVALYSSYYSTFTKPMVFSSVYVCWFFNPHAAYKEDYGEATYGNPMHSFHNIMILFGVSGLYIVFVIAMLTKLCTVRGGSNLSVSQWMTFLQVLAISFFNGYAAGLYVYLQYVPVTQFLIYTATYSWTTAHGLPCVIYVLLNKTIRDDLIKMCKWSFKLNRNWNNSVAPIARSIPNITKGTMFHKQSVSKSNIEKSGQLNM
ncbi:serpentine type 7TM GPCR chemoreceptor srt domain-containing protein [Ditylenchus destructor]|uniref:Serpentine type 7TM GPCR chemoreceptor srt domain-containing protein n=1 Tax=Ditylenchus destructor TaxID=166010 RepID=A0AAD4MSR3_9BILA|nr:serpentine type 7TM GPCR chemoreceptor srt domain-containing protein [Ditylenchus destructor]